MIIFLVNIFFDTLFVHMYIYICENILIKKQIYVFSSNLYFFITPKVEFFINLIYT